jgi:hypothetical protein
MTFSQHIFMSRYSHLSLCSSVRKSLEVAFSAQLSAISVLSCFLTWNVLIDGVVRTVTIMIPQNFLPAVAMRVIAW